MTHPKTLNEAVARARTLLTSDDKDALRGMSLGEARWRLHLTLGYQLRAELGLWSVEAQTLFADMNAKMPHRLIIKQTPPPTLS